MKRVLLLLAVVATGVAVGRLLRQDPLAPPPAPEPARPQQKGSPREKARGFEPLPRPFSVARLEKALEGLRPESLDQRIEYARLSAWLADNHPDKSAQERHAAAGLKQAEAIEQAAPNNPAGPYWHAICLGLWLRHNRLAAMSRVKVAEQKAKRTVALDEKYFHAGGHRYLALLYQEAPAFLVSKGAGSRIRTHLDAAVRLAPDYAENQLNLSRYLATRDRELSRKHARLAAGLLEKMPADDQVKRWRQEAQRLGR